MHYFVAVLAGAASVAAQVVSAPAAANTALQTALPRASGTSALRAVQTIRAGQSFDCGMKLYDRSPSTCSEQAEGGDDDAVFLLQEGATLSNCIIGPRNGEGVHCKGTCTLNNVWWSDVCEDAVTFTQKSGISYVNGGGAFNADDKVMQHNGGGTVAVKNFYGKNIGKLYRSCGNCEGTYARTSTFDNILIEGGDIVVGINGNFGGT
ncbi:hypothetical protein LTS18_003006 [Coniosporium uncinatum]|uniref:Uncharacterized protein n=1 Tax=Coniosporium uncinatum TaxID=93489 RepID=A0ACC3DTT3_9PEZI|nr:hypothetical protein LTS18_003006 [Coniosporium uncinatum]